ncbi:MAG: oxygenase MpaB family protein [Polyangiales bacterium]
MISNQTLAEVQRELRRAGSVSARIAELDPECDFLEIYRLHALADFPWDTTRALELALFRTYCVPSIGGLLDATREFSQRGQVRYEDTSLLLTHVLEHGFQGPGLAALRRINQLHARFTISNEDMLYVLSTFVSVPMRWLARYGWRPLLEAERIAAHNYYRELGTHMGIRDIPRTWPELVAFGDAYEREHYRYTEASARVGEATREILVGWFPRALAPVVRNAVHALLDAPVRAAFGFPAAPVAFQRGIEHALKLRARALAKLPARTRIGAPSGEIMLRVRRADASISTLGPDGTPLPGASEPRCPMTPR